MNLCVIGTGYVGLVTGSVFADLGNEVVCVDNNHDKIHRLCRGEMPIYEPGLEEMVKRNTDDHRLAFTTHLEPAVEAADLVFICVGTPPTPTGEPDLRFVQEAAQGIARALNRYKVIVTKSTVPVGTGDLVRQILLTNRRRSVDFDVVSNPEFLREGSAIKDTLEPERIVIGAPSQSVALKLLELYAPLERPMIITDVASAEMIKYASNAFLATKISFANSMALLCDAVGADIAQVVKGMGMDTRIGAAFLSAGLGYGGSCFPKDTVALVRTAEQAGVELKLLEAVMAVNAEQTPRFVGRLREALGGFEGKVVGVLGLAFKPNTDDLREAKSVELVGALLAEGAQVKAYDPIAMEKAREVFGEVWYGKNAYEVAEGAEALVVVTEWNEFKLLNMERVKGVMKRALVFDGRNLYDPGKLRRLGFEYHCIGRTNAVVPTKY